MKGERREESDQQRAIRRALEIALGLAGSPLLIDRVAEEDFAASIERLRGVPGTNTGGNNGKLDC